jgi:hypothetical protein
MYMKFPFFFGTFNGARSILIKNAWNRCGHKIMISIVVLHLTELAFATNFRDVS